MRIVPFGIIWFAFSIIYTLLEKGLLGDLDHYPSTGNPYNFERNILVTPVAALITGLFIGTLEVLYFNKWFSQKSFTRKILYKSTVYLVILLLFTIILSLAANFVQLKTSVFSRQVWTNVWTFVSHYSFISVLVYMVAAILVSQFYAEVSESIGHEALNNFFTGKYYQPIERKEFTCFLI